ncbi:hypothetical protein BKA61DRAFT_43263 [Leptodontidium sp. MPI-SDFR-AT-0119]|nr:hypothetical protein BKA61DRAFT_43263 [Leptodontidium sp. MPI-SDFR-AT-0119]
MLKLLFFFCVVLWGKRGVQKRGEGKRTERKRGEEMPRRGIERGERRGEAEAESSYSSAAGRWLPRFLFSGKLELDISRNVKSCLMAGNGRDAV